VTNESVESWREMPSTGRLLQTLMLTEGKLSGEGMRKLESTERVWL